MTIVLCVLSGETEPSDIDTAMKLGALHGTGQHKIYLGWSVFVLSILIIIVR